MNALKNFHQPINNYVRASTWRCALSALLIPALALVSNNAWADGWTGFFTINSLYVSGPGNYAYRVYGFPSGTACTQTWAYINQTDSGSQWYAASILTAYSTGKQLNLLVQTDGSGYCHILEMNLQG